MFNPTQLVIDSFVTTLRDNYARMYGLWEPEYANIVAFVGRMALENIANSDAPYHDVAQTVLVTAVGQEILRGKQLSRGGVGPRDWLNFTVSLLCYDIGYVRGVCAADRKGAYVIDEDGNTIDTAPGATDAAMTPYHVARSKIFVRERFGNVGQIDAEEVARNIELTTFPVPNDREHAATDDFPGLLRAADLIGRLADIDYLRKSAHLFREFAETGTAEKLGMSSPADVRRGYPGFFWQEVRPWVEDALRHLQVTQEGKQWIASLYGNVFAAEHNAPGLGRPA